MEEIDDDSHRIASRIFFVTRPHFSLRDLEIIDLELQSSWSDLPPPPEGRSRVWVLTELLYSKDYNVNPKSVSWLSGKWNDDHVSKLWHIATKFSARGEYDQIFDKLIGGRSAAGYINSRKINATSGMDFIPKNDESQRLLQEVCGLMTANNSKIVSTGLGIRHSLHPELLLMGLYSNDQEDYAS